MELWQASDSHSKLIFGGFPYKRQPYSQTIPNYFLYHHLASRRYSCIHPSNTPSSRLCCAGRLLPRLWLREPKLLPSRSTRGYLETGPLDSTPIARKPSSGVRKILRLQNKPPASHAAQSRPVQSSTNQQTCTKPKRLQTKRTKKTKGKCPPKQYRRCPHSRLNPSEENLRKYPEAEVKANERQDVHPLELLQKPTLSERDLRSLYKEVMDSVKAASAVKRTSRFILSQSEEGTVQTQRSFYTSTSNYRHHNLRAFRIFIHIKPPNEIAAAINKALGFKHLRYSNSAEWQMGLKPVDQYPLEYSPDDEADDDLAWLQKRQQRSAGKYMSSEFSQTSAPTYLPAHNPQESNTIPPLLILP
ncbi:hypothetical protein GP486_007074 [Trichoglossum hirsutum]|uniref:Uncharacterized protein n=1 Tax=Trichoglossum hirsutum TaxID=265104 RepID=A0A9P8ICK7_9PEZI|nr:hypothetical protein GP486_007074 [Trichoglossum hirsutum]